MTNRVLRCAALAALIASSGCSIALQDRPRSGKGPAVAAHCSSSKLLPVLDTAGAVAGLGGMIAGSYLAIAEERGKAGNTIAGLSALVGIVYLASAGNGFRWASECGEQPAPAAMTATR